MCDRIEVKPDSVGTHRFALDGAAIQRLVLWDDLELCSGVDGLSSLVVGEVRELTYVG